MMKCQNSFSKPNILVLKTEVIHKKLRSLEKIKPQYSGLCLYLEDNYYSPSRLLKAFHYLNFCKDYNKVIFLELSRNALSLIPHQVSRMKNLQALYFNNNALGENLHTISYLKNLKKLRWIELKNNGLSQEDKNYIQSNLNKRITLII